MQVTKEKTRVVYNFERKGRAINDDEIGTEGVEKSSGEFPSCLPPEWKETYPATNPSINYVEKDCSCGSHMFYWVRIPKEIWPEEAVERVRVMERA